MLKFTILLFGMLFSTTALKLSIQVYNVEHFRNDAIQCHLISNINSNSRCMLKRALSKMSHVNKVIYVLNKHWVIPK